MKTRNIITLFLCLFLFISTAYGQTMPANIEQAIKASPVETKEMFTKFLEKIYNWMDRGGDTIGGAIVETTEFASKQVPIVCKEIVWFGIAKNGTFCSIGLILIIVGISFFISLSKDKRAYFISYKVGGEDFIDHPTFRFTKIFLSALPFGIGLLIFVNYISGLLMAIFAPRLYILQQIMEMIKSVK